METLRLIQGRSYEFRAQLERIDGSHESTVMTEGCFPWKRRLVAEAGQIEERTPDRSVYLPSKGYLRVEQMARS